MGGKSKTVKLYNKKTERNLEQVSRLQYIYAALENHAIHPWAQLFAWYLYEIRSAVSPSTFEAKRPIHFEPLLAGYRVVAL